MLAVKYRRVENDYQLETKGGNERKVEFRSDSVNKLKQSKASLMLLEKL